MDMRETLAELDRRQAETFKVCPEQHKLAAEMHKPWSDSYLAPVMALASLILSGVCLVTLILYLPK
jgi:hypothetical protein